jgi:sec-independent protein translocase protein TatA
MTLINAVQSDPLTCLTFAFGIPGGYEWIILLVIALLIFGRRLPEVGRWLGQGIVEFKKGVKGISDEIDEASGERRPPERIAEQSQQSSTHAHETSERERQTVPRSSEPSEEKHHLDQ